MGSKGVYLMAGGRKWLEARGEIIVEVCGGATLYEWDQFDVWRRHSDDRLFLYLSGGCSCDGPYDHVSSWDDLEPITSLVAFKRELERADAFGDATERMQAYSEVAKALPSTGGGRRDARS